MDSQETNRASERTPKARGISSEQRRESGKHLWLAPEAQAARSIASCVTIPLSLAHSPDPDDVFMWWPITGMIEPPIDAQRIVPARVISKPEIDTGGFEFTSIAADIAALNRRAAERGDLDITALSMFAWAHVRARYRLTSFGSSFGEGYGPRVVRRKNAQSLNDATRSLTLPDDAIIAVPGTRTTAFLLLNMAMGQRAAGLRFVEMEFDRILDAVARGDRGVTHGLLIHQSQLTFAELGLELVVDLGSWWQDFTGMALPLGGNAIRRDVDQRFGAGTAQRLANVMQRSLCYALEHRERSTEYAMKFAPELSRESAERYLDMYVSPLTIDCGERGRQAIERLVREGARIGLCPDVPNVDLLRPGGLA